MTVKGKLLGALAVTVGLTVGRPSDARAQEWSCNQEGQCSHIAYCWGDYANGFCYIQCYVESPGGCGGLPGTCYEPAGSADCGRPV
jgi:hypothetical protein